MSQRGSRSPTGEGRCCTGGARTEGAVTSTSSHATRDSHLYSTADPHAHARTHRSANTEQPHTHLGDPEAEGVLDGVTAGEAEGEVEPEADVVADGDDDADKVALAVSLWAWPWTNDTM